jgi:Rha family phage regulatory protein
MMTTDLVFNGNGKAVTNSVLVAKKFGKEHKHVLESIRPIIKGCAEFSADPMFEETEYINEQNGQAYPMFLMNRDGFSLLAMGFTGKQALKFKMDFVGAFNKMEEALKRTTMTALPDFTNPAEAARAWAEQFELKQIEAKRADEAEQQVLALTSEIEQMQPKVSYYDNILANKSTVLITQIAQDYGMSAKALNRTLNELGVQHKVNDQWILYAKFLGQGYVQSKPVTITHNNGRQSVKYNTEWTQKGRLFLYDELKKHNILPLIEMSQQF